MANIMKKKIIIIGAGISGLSAALRLKKLGFSNVYIFEAKQSLGGRTKTIQMGSYHVEMGAQWIHGQKENIIYEIANSNNLVDKNADNYSDILHSFNFYPKEKNIINLLFEYLDDKMENISDRNKNSVLSYLTNYFNLFMVDYSQHAEKEILNEAFNWFCKFQCELNGCQHLSLVSINLLNTYKECDEHQTVELKKGYGSLLDLFLKDIPTDWILTDHFVTKIDWSKFTSENIDHFKYTDFSKFDENPINNKYIKILCENGKEYIADHVIITLPLGHLKKCSDSLFHPCLSEKKQLAISCLGFGTVNKIFLHFDIPFWNDNIMINVLWHKKFDEYFPDEDLSTHKSSSQVLHWVKCINRYAYTPSHPNMLCAWVVGEGAVILESLPDVKVINDCMTLLELLLEKKLPKPNQILRSSWYSDSFTCGSYSYLSVECEKENISHLDLAEPEYFNSHHPVLQFAGEATHPYYFSTVHGAYESGIREAERLFQYYRNEDKLEHYDKMMILNYKIADLFLSKKRVRKNLKIIIVGAGIAGLSCAFHLAKNEFIDIKILEAQDKIGGRIHSFVYDQTVLELGAQWIHGTENELYKFAKLNDLLSESPDVSYEGEGIFCTSSGNIIESHLVREVKDLLIKIKTELEEESTCFKDKSVLSSFTETFESYIKNDCDTYNVAVKQGLFDWFLKFEVIDNACDSLDSIAAESYADWDDCPSDEYHINIKNGFYSVIEMLQSKTQMVDIFLNKAAKRIKWQENFIRTGYSEALLNECFKTNYPVKVECEDETFFADSIIVTSSIGFLKENCNSLFIPPLPVNKSKAFENIGFGTINKIYLIYHEAFWAPNDRGIQFIWIKTLNEECKRLKNENPWISGITGFDVYKQHSNILVGWIGGQEAKVIETVSEEIIGSICTKLFKIFLCRMDIPEPIKVFRSQWFHNKYVKGAYSNRKLSFYQSDDSLYQLQCPLFSTYKTKQDLEIQWPTVLFAGEAFDSHSFSSAHGAYQSGFEAAKSILNACIEIEDAEELKKSKLFL